MTSSTASVPKNQGCAVRWVPFLAIRDSDGFQSWVHRELCEFRKSEVSRTSAESFGLPLRGVAAQAREHGGTAWPNEQTEAGHGKERQEAISGAAERG